MKLLFRAPTLRIKADKKVFFSNGRSWVSVIHSGLPVWFKFPDNLPNIGWTMIMQQLILFVIHSSLIYRLFIRLLFLRAWISQLGSGLSKENFLCCLKRPSTIIEKSGLGAFQQFQMKFKNLPIVKRKKKLIWKTKNYFFGLENFWNSSQTGVWFTSWSMWHSSMQYLFIHLYLFSYLSIF